MDLFNCENLLKKESISDELIYTERHAEAKCFFFFPHRFVIQDIAITSKTKPITMKFYYFEREEYGKSLILNLR